MRIESPAFEDGESIPAVYTCDGKNINPPLRFIDIPAETVTLALIVEDPDVPRKIRTDGTWDHWVVWNIPPTITEVGENELPTGNYGANSSGEEKYEGPCPPDGEHRYYFRLYALDAELTLKPGSTKAKLLNAIHGHVIADATLLGRYTRIAQ